jgi:hypothetical protein
MNSKCSPFRLQSSRVKSWGLRLPWIADGHQCRRLISGRLGWLPIRQRRDRKRGHRGRALPPERPRHPTQRRPQQGDRSRRIHLRPTRTHVLLQNRYRCNCQPQSREIQNLTSYVQLPANPHTNKFTVNN